MIKLKPTFICCLSHDKNTSKCLTSSSDPRGDLCEGATRKRKKYLREEE